MTANRRLVLFAHRGRQGSFGAKPEAHTPSTGSPLCADFGPSREQHRGAGTGDRSGDAAGGANQQPFARNENAIEGAPHIGILGRRLTPENATLLDEDVLAIV